VSWNTTHTFSACLWKRCREPRPSHDSFPCLARSHDRRFHREKGREAKVTRIRYLILAVLLAVVTACSGVQQPDMVAIVQDTAVAHLRNAADEVFPTGYKLEEVPRLPLNCSNGGTLYGIQYIVHGIDRTENDSYFDRMKLYWQAYGWKIQNDDRPNDMFMNADKDDYLMSVRGGMTGQIAIGESTPCV
jgi:hypothetical protein